MDADIIRMAREAGLLYTSETSADWSAPIPKSDYPLRLKRFYNIVRAAEQDRCCRIIFGMAGSDNVAQRTVDAIRSKNADTRK